MKHTLALFLLTILPLYVYAQDNFTKGYIITHDQDTIWGMIDFKLDKDNSHYCRFQADSASESTIYFPKDITGYRFTDEGKYYVSRKITLDGRKRFVFLEYLVKGLMNLYYYVLDEQPYFFFENQDGDMMPVTQKPDRIDEYTPIKDQRYIGIVKYIFKDYEAIDKQTKDLRFNQKDFIQITKSYHDAECTTGEECIIFENKRPDYTGDKVKFSVYAGVQLSIFIPSHSKNSKPQSLSNISPIIGTQFKFINPRWSKSVSGQLDVSLSWFNKTNSMYFLNSFNDKETQYIDVYKATALTARLGARYTHQKTKLRPMIEGGLAFSLLLVNSSKRTMITDYLKDEWDQEIKKFHLGIYGAAGLEYNIYKEQSVFLQLVLEAYLKTEVVKGQKDESIRMPHIKIGYTF